MPFRMTVLGSDVEIDLPVDDPAGTTLSEVRELLEPLTGPWPPGWEEEWRAGGEPVAAAVLGRPPLLAGALVPGPPAAPAPAGVPVRVVAGPAAGRLLSLGAGTHLVGRPGAASALALDDPSVSRRHAEVTVHDDGSVSLRDRGSLNGTTWLRGDGREPVRDGCALELPARVAVGDTVLHLGPLPPRPASVRPDGRGHLLLNRPPRLVPQVEARVLDWPAEQPAPERPELPVLALLVPLAVAGVLALVWSPLSLLLGLASPLLVGGQWWTQRRRWAAGALRRGAELAAARDAVRRTHREALAAEHARAHDLAPDAGALLAEVLARGERLFARSAEHPDHLHCRLGLGDRPALTCLVRPARAGAAGTAGTADGGAEAPDPLLHDVPVDVDLTRGPLGLAGDRPALLRTARLLLAQVAAWHSPASVRLAVAGDGEEWAWTRWLPHLDASDGTALDAAARALARRRATTRGGPERWAGEDHLVVLLDGVARWRSDPRLAELLVAGARHGVHVVCLAPTVSELPAECRSVVDLAPAPARSHTEQGSVDFRADGVDASWAEAVARALAPLRDAGGVRAATTPVDVRLGDLLGPTGPEDLARTWRAPAPGLTVALGAGAGGTRSVDLVADGPHALVAGTTGSGKSVLLRTLVAGLCAGFSPQAVQLVLVDYKGGAAFGPCTRFPHVAGVVTDLDEQLAARVLRSLRAEVRRREEVLARAGADDVRDLPLGRLPRLVVVVDEFRVLSQELPDFVDGLVRLAVVGRSLGVHLVLATQRPAGVVSPEIRANTNLRIALRVQDRVDAEDVVGDPAPAGFSDRTPGRAVLRRGSEGLETFQVARLSGPARERGVRVRAPGAGSAAGEVDDLPLLVDAVVAAAAGGEVPPAPWSPPLPGVLPPDEVPAGPGAVLTWGLLDRPDAQRREVAGWDLGAGGHLLVVGGVRSGRTTLLRRLVTAAGRGPGAAEVEVHVLDAGGGLVDLAGRGRTGSVVTAAEVWRAGRLLQRLQEEVERRRALGAAPGAGAPLVVLVVDGWEAWSTALAGADPSAGPEALLRLLREASGVGFRVVVAADRQALTGPVAAACAQVVLLRLPDRTDAALLGVRPAEVPRHAPPGRGLLVVDGRGHEVQVALPFPLPAPGPPARLAVAPLPARVDDGDAVDAVVGVGGSSLPLGRGGDAAEVVTVDPAGTVLVCGPPGSGRTSVLRVLAAAEARAGRTASWAREARPEELGEVLAGGGLVLVDDVGRPLPPGVEDVLVAALARGGPVRLVVAGDGAEVAGAFRGLAALARTGARTTVLLGREGTVPAEVVSRRPVAAPGRGAGAGFVVRGGRWTSVRVATAGAEPAGAGTGTATWPTVVV
ncbi:S-DNA-T family DNA segregation ATPase FtsK/SpoIIIE [Kineococcus radiotolerans]|uniref:S-DNA-T family DNA segregation ATPase FtsK/SpoIIIE n=1 Tax=Kineococcus radiotolerans TaxID=131568 RepID=A0A7W4TNR0_KINRA|nr:FtsK/SpoIIIE domain-containing protein [Kineococcus radiotolerans]MBB2902125.1 S-DNA-T family DNA segregation ATPase FtsK/SpoIIIE [Kineococcus radiotolerans]